MDKFLIRGGRPLHGPVQVSGAKNAALPEMCAALLTQDAVTLHRVPHLRDVATMQRLLQHMGASLVRDGAGATAAGGAPLRIHAGELTRCEAPYELVKTMRASVLALGPLLARCGHARVSLPGGCAIGSRPVDQHIKGLQAMGADITVTHGDIHARLPPGKTRLRGAHITTDMITVTGTENLLMAATLADGVTVLENAAMEPEVVDLAHMLIQMGARISGHGTGRITIEGVPRLHGCVHHVAADRIEAGTFLCAAAATGGDIAVHGVNPAHLGALLDKLDAAGAQIRQEESSIHLRSDGHLRAQSVRTSEYPGFATDMQAQFMAFNLAAHGSSTVTETIFENRFMHVQEMLRLGAHIRIDARTAHIDGGKPLSGACVMATDLRASAGLVIAALVASGETSIERIYHLDRGYERLEDKLRLLGADIHRVAA